MTGYNSSSGGGESDCIAIATQDEEVHITVHAGPFGLIPGSAQRLAGIVYPCGL